MSEPDISRDQRAPGDPHHDKKKKDENLEEKKEGYDEIIKGQKKLIKLLKTQTK
jgi:hypothetical protein